MAFARPTLSDLITRIEADFVSRLTLTGALLRRALVRVLARVLAGAAHMLHGHLEYLGKQLFADQSDDAFLVRQADLYGITKTPPTFARATLAVTGTTGMVVPAGTALTRTDGQRYLTDASVTLVAGAAAPTVTAVTAGALPTLTAGVALTFESPISGVNSATAAATNLADGSDQEGTESLRARLLARLADPPQGGDPADYVAWAKEVSGVTRAWVTTWKDTTDIPPGGVLVRFVRDNDSGGLIPDAGEVAAVQSHLNVVAPAHALVTAAAPLDAPTAFTIHVSPATTAMQAAVRAQLVDLVNRTGAPGGTVLLSAIHTAIGNTEGLTDYSLTVPAADVTSLAHQLLSVGTITWV